MKKIVTIILVVVMVVSITSVASAAYEWNWPTQRQGASNNYVRALQTVIKYNRESGFNNDGISGSGTTAAVKRYQDKNGLGVDGIVGSGTWGNMEGKISNNGSQGWHTYFAIIQPSGYPTNTSFFDRHYMQPYAYWSVYKAAPGDATGTWYKLN